MSETPARYLDRVQISRNVENYYHNFNITMQLNQNVSPEELSTALREIIGTHPILAYQAVRKEGTNSEDDRKADGRNWVRKPVDVIRFDDVIEYRTLDEPWGETFVADLDPIFFTLGSTLPLWKVIVSEYHGLQRISFVCDLIFLDCFCATSFVDDLTFQLSRMELQPKFHEVLFDSRQTFIEPQSADSILLKKRHSLRSSKLLRHTFKYNISTTKHVVRLVLLTRVQADLIFQSVSKLDKRVDNTSTLDSFGTKTDMPEGKENEDTKRDTNDDFKRDTNDFHENQLDHDSNSDLEDIDAEHIEKEHTEINSIDSKLDETISNDNVGIENFRDVQDHEDYLKDITNDLKFTSMRNQIEKDQDIATNFRNLGSRHDRNIQSLPLDDFDQFTPKTRDDFGSNIASEGKPFHFNENESPEPILASQIEPYLGDAQIKPYLGAAPLKPNLEAAPIKPYSEAVAINSYSDISTAYPTSDLNVVPPLEIFNSTTTELNLPLQDSANFPSIPNGDRATQTPIEDIKILTPFFHAVLQQSLRKSLLEHLGVSPVITHAIHSDFRVLYNRFKAQPQFRYNVASKTDTFEIKAKEPSKRVMRMAAECIQQSREHDRITKHRKIWKSLLSKMKENRRSTISSFILGSFNIKYGDWVVEDLVFSQNTAFLSYIGLNAVATPTGINMTICYSKDFEAEVNENEGKVMDTCLELFKEKLLEYAQKGSNTGTE